MSGKVYLVGAGPGDPELLTLKALRVLKQADVILHDDLVSAAILKLAVPGTRLIDVGKRCGPKKVSQENINARLIGYARSGLDVVRLKGGDPLVFGRAGEEITALRRAGIEFEIIPGVTSAMAAAAAAEVPLTHRALASTLIFLTGHPAGDGPEWPAVNAGGRESSTLPARASATVVVYMPGPANARLRDRLLGMGFDDRTPCLIVSGTSTSNCKTHRTTLTDLPAAPSLDPPRILIVGEVASLARQESSRPATLPSATTSAGIASPSRRALSFMVSRS